MSLDTKQPVPQRPGLWARLRSMLSWRSTRYSVAAIAVIGAVAGVLFWGAFNWAMEATNTEPFCLSCHEMKNNVYAEYTQTIHYNNRSGVRAICTDCHVPKEWVHKVVRKVYASRELFHKAMGSIDTKEKFEAKRLDLATRVWTAMKKTDSRECRNCHGEDFMDFTRQESRSAKRHEEAFQNKQTCIDCHRGIAHRLPAGSEERYRQIEKEYGGTRAALENYLDKTAAVATPQK